MTPIILLCELEDAGGVAIALVGSLYIIMWAVTRSLYAEEFYGELDMTEGGIEGLLWPLALPAILLYKLCKKWKRK